MTTVAAKERGIVFTAESVRALLDGRKSQSRRVIQPQPPHWLAKQLDSGFRVMRPLGDNCWGAMTCAEGETTTAYACRSEDMIRCPYGKPGDVLYCKETYLFLDSRHWHERGNCSKLVTVNGRPKRNGVEYRADCRGDEESERCRRELGYKWRSPRFMPKWASRLRRTLTDVGCERVNEISEADAIAEGFRSVEEFAQTWDAINARRGYPFDSGARCWVLKFERETRNGG